MSTEQIPALAPLSVARAAPSAVHRKRLRRPITTSRGILLITAFFALLGVLGYGLDALITGGLRAIPTSKFGSLNRVMTGRVNAEIVINGSSRALTHYDPRIIHAATGHSAWNLGMNGVQIDVQLAILKAYLEHNVAPKLVIQNLEAFSFVTTRPGEIYDPALYLPYVDDPGLYASLRAIDPTVWKWKHFPLYGYAVEDARFTWIFGLLAHVGFAPKEDYFQGFNPRSTPWTGDFERFRASVPDGVRYAIEPAGMRALVELIQLCQSRDIDVILVYSPEFIEMQALQRNRPQIFARFAELSTRFQVPFWDFSASPLGRDKINFYNSEHLNASGAAAFSRELAHQLALAGYGANAPVAAITPRL
jgi:hypothetical protein